MAETSPDTIAPEIQRPLARLREAIRRYLTVDTLLSVAIFAVSYFWISLVLDYAAFRLFGADWVQLLPRGFRQVLLVGLLASLAVFLVRKLLVPLFKPLEDRSLALILEQKFPERLGGRLITAVELADTEKQAKYGYSPGLIRQTIREAHAGLEGLPIHEVMNRRRLKAKRRWLVGLSLLLFTAVSLGVILIRGMKVPQYFAQASDVGAILIERNVLLKNTPWPRSVHLELVDFPGDELRVGKDNSSPRLRVAAYKWVVADNSTVDGWRPLTWADLPRFVKPDEIPALPIKALRDGRTLAEYGSFVVSGVAYAAVVPLPAELADVPEDLKRWKVDRVEQIFIGSEDSVKRLRALLDADSLIKMENLFGTLQAKAADSANSRKLRKLEIPAEVALDYWGPKSSVEMNLRKETAGEFSGTLTDLRETVRFNVRGDDYVSPTRRIVLVPAPQLIELTRDEFQPAYLHHTPPYDSTKPPLLIDPPQMKGLKQELRNLGISLTGDRSRFDIRAGTDLALHAVVDKELSAAAILPKPGKYPGVEADAEPKPIPLAVGPDGKTVDLRFDEASKNAIARLTEFELEFIDKDNVKSRRLLSIMPLEDKAPEVEVAIDVIRRVGNQYMCTAKAIIPVSKDSKVRDDNGLARVEFTWSTVEIESPVVLASRATAMAPLFLSTPQFPSIGDAIQRAAVLRAYVPLMRSQVQASGEVSELVPAFVEEFKLRAKKQTLENLKAALKQAPPPADLSPIVKTFEFRTSDETSFFDLRTYARSLEEKDDRVAQKSYLLTLNVSATDTNVDTGPKVSQNKEPYFFKLVSEGELLAEISREEATLALKLDEVIRRLEDLIAKYSGVVSRVGLVKERDDFIPEQTRIGELGETLGKARDTTSEVSSSYTRILKEYRFNRFRDDLVAKLDEKIVRPLDEVTKAEFPDAETAFAAFAAELANFQPPTPLAAQATRERLDLLLAKLKRIREEMGGITGIQQLIIALQKITEAQERDIKARLQAKLESQQAQLFSLGIIPPPPVTIEAGKKLTVTVGVAVGLAYTGDPVFQVEVPGDSGLKAPKEVKFEDTAVQVPIEFEAGAKKGEFRVKLIPAKGPVAELKVIVK